MCLRIAWFILLSLMLCNCSNIQVNLDNKLYTELPRQKRINYYFWGLVSNENVITSSELCGTSELVDIKYYSDFGSVLAHYFTIGVWSPKKIEYQCLKDLVLNE